MEDVSSFWLCATLAGDAALFNSVASTAAPSVNGDYNTDYTHTDLEGLGGIEKKLSEKDVSPDVVEWDGPADPECPRNWKPVRKFFFTVITSSVILAVSFGSSVFAPATAVTAAQFGVSPIVMQLSVTLWILGLAVGPILFGPLSEVFGHLIPFSVTVLGLAAFQLPVALAENVPTILIGRFLAGAFGSGSYSIVSGQYYELYDLTLRGSEETPVELEDIVHKYLTKPVRMFATEPILVIFTAYLTLVYGTLYLAFQAFPLAYRQRGWSATASELPFVAVMLGIMSACGICSLFALTWYKARVSQNKTAPQPEWRLPPMALGAVILPPALLWFGWSGNVHWISQVIASYFIGLGLQLIFIAGITYIVDVYRESANSAMSIHVVVRSLIASSFPLFATEMYEQLGVAWASSVLALLSLIMAPAPLLFWVYGSRIRSWSHFSSTLD
ncbi:putative mfs multidrug protein [Eutypa lata UCREL1]|uniref:Putative mfs multidrug protein n=1 Tax=Eutypa lata (strain UCR-EL1) TaxID=1287681 RepID=M7SHI9_EUTLA|nr:putative mfs multidrug protein [Eutypa lata UCREL1]